MGLFTNWLAHPLTRGLSVDDPRTTLRRRQIIVEKRFLRALYDEWYSLILVRLPASGGGVLELGSGAGFFRERLPGLITSEVFATPGVDRVVDACQLPFADSALAAIVMTDVFHHIPDVGRFLAEVSRCLRPGGKVVMIEPWRTPWAEWVYTHLHHEPFLPTADRWELPTGGPLSVANGALPWMVFARDGERFAAEYPSLTLRTIQPLMPLAYLLSGGVSLRPLMPGSAYPWVRRLERWIGEDRYGMFALIELERQPA